MPTVDLHVVGPVVYGVLHASCHLRRLALHEEATATVENHVACEGHPVDILAHLVPRTNPLHCVLHSLCHALLRLEYEGE